MRKLKSNKAIVVFAFIVLCLSRNSYAQGKEPLHPKSSSITTKSDTINSDIKFEYQVATKECSQDFFKTKGKQSIMKNIIKIQFIRSGGACTYSCRLEKNYDTLNIHCGCVQGSAKKHLACYLINCKISGLKKGVYYLNYEGIENEKIEIK
jgi:hypothetical protein